MKPMGARGVSPLELYLRPHRYVPIKIDHFIQSEMKKNQ